LHFLFWTYITACLINIYYFVAMHEIDGQTPFKDLTRYFTMLPWSTLFMKCLGR
jgi:hypothetical protein